MNLDDLIKIGRFGYRFKDDGAFDLRVNSNFDPELLTLNYFFVVIDDLQVRYVSLLDLTLSGSRLKGRFQEQGLIRELRRAEKVWLAIDIDTYESLVEPEDELVGFALYDRDKRIGVITGVFNNTAHDVLVITLDEDEKSIMIPDVPDFVVSKDYPGKRVTVQDITGFLDL